MRGDGRKCSCSEGLERVVKLVGLSVLMQLSLVLLLACQDCGPVLYCWRICAEEARVSAEESLLVWWFTCEAEKMHGGA